MRAIFGAAEGGGAVVSLARDGKVLKSIEGSGAADLLALLEKVLKEARAKRSDLTEIAVDRGPDGFSTVRRRVAVAVGLSRALDVPVAATSGLDAAAMAALPSSDFTRASVVPLYAGAPNITASKKKKTWTTH